MRAFIQKFVLAIFVLAILPLTAQAELESLFINVKSFYDDINTVHNIIEEVDGVTDSYANSKNNMITVIYDTESTSKDEILSQISYMGYGIKYNSPSQDLGLIIKYIRIDNKNIEIMRDELDNNPYVIDYYINQKTNLISVIYSEKVNDRGISHNINPTSNSFSIYHDDIPGKYLQKN